ncbi:EKC/KEOPS complex subunit TPRKB-like [Apis cerana]|uniref:TP53RK-binding protein n=1 Tax=Apis cerana cerana TaxID=94128 RepID=A0A2A3E210_APICC|nr:EKC/KEOPS complex subunit TPRKB-like [Apis cerana]PBC25564.1 TP53RK-binding protein [Apis cerana cerana]
MSDYTVSLDPETEMFCTLYLFENVQNSNEIRRKVMNNELSCSVIKASLIVDPFQIIIAANKTAINAKMNQITTKNIYTEVLFNLSTSKNISRTLIEFGINDDDKNILIMLIYKDDNDKKLISKTIMDVVKGESISISRLSEFTDFDLIKKIYKIEEDELNVSNFIDSIVSRISCKDFMSFK